MGFQQQARLHTYLTEPSRCGAVECLGVLAEPVKGWVDPGDVRTDPAGVA